MPIRQMPWSRMLLALLIAACGLVPAARSTEDLDPHLGYRISAAEREHHRRLDPADFPVRRDLPPAFDWRE